MQRRDFLAGLASTGLLSCATRSAAARGDPSINARIKIRAGQYLVKTGAVGLSVAVGRGREIIFRGAYGLADIDRRAPATTKTKFRIASVSKSITATTIFKLKEQARLDLDQPVFEVGGPLQHLVARDTPKKFLSQVTCRNLLNHTSGAWSQKLHGSDPMFWPSELSQADLIQRALQHGWWQLPNTAFGYSNFGYCLLGRVIERITGRPYDQATHELTLAPSGAGSMRLAAAASVTNKPAGHTDEAKYFWSFRPEIGGGPIEKSLLNVRRMDAASGWVATADELVRFLLHVDGRPQLPDLLTSKTRQEMMQPTTFKSTYAHGWKIDRDTKAIVHNGSLPGTMASIVIDVHGNCIAALSNARAPNAHRDQFAMLTDVVAVLGSANGDARR